MRANKFNAKRTTVDGISFGSQIEARRYSELVLLQKAKHISGLTPHPRFALLVNGIVVGHYTADSSYMEKGVYVIEEVKSKITAKQADYVLRRNVFKAINPSAVFREIIR